MMIIDNVEMIVEPKTGIGYAEGEAIQVYPASQEWPVGGVMAQSIVDAVSPGSAWSFSGKDIGPGEDGFSGERLMTVLIFTSDENDESK